MRAYRVYYHRANNPTPQQAFVVTKEVPTPETEQMIQIIQSRHSIDDVTEIINIKEVTN